MVKTKTREPNETVNLGPTVSEVEHVFAIANIFVSSYDTFIHVTDLSGKKMLARVTGGMKVKLDLSESSSPYAAMLASEDVAQRCKELGITALHIKLRVGGYKNKAPGPGAQSAIRALARSGMKIGCIEDLTPVATDKTRDRWRIRRRL